MRFRNRSESILGFVFVGLCCAHGPLAAATEAELSLVSPGDLERAVEISSRCPTFSWVAPELPYSIDTVTLGVWELVAGPDQLRPVLEVSLPASTTNWTPSLDRCFSAGAALAWSVFYRDSQGLSELAQPRLFRAPERVPRADLEEALSILRAYERAAGEDDVGLLLQTAPSTGVEDLEGSALDRISVSPGSPDEREAPSAAAADQRLGEVSAPVSVASFSVGAGIVTAASYTGDGSGLTGVVASNLVCNGCVDASEVTSAIQRRVTGVCAVGSAIRQVNPDGSVVCEVDNFPVLSEVWSASAMNGGIDLAGGPAVASSVCYLTSVEMQDIDNSTETATCRIVEFGTGNPIWQLQAFVTPGKDGDVWCEMSCISF